MKEISFKKYLLSLVKSDINEENNRDTIEKFKSFTLIYYNLDLYNVFW